MNHRDTEAQRDPLTNKVIGAAIEVHRILGPGMLESVYELCLCQELGLLGIPLRRQVPIPIRYKGVELDGGFRLDIVVDNALILELKTVDSLMPIHEAQLLSYMRMSGLKTGLLINFNVPVLKNGIKRMKM